MNRWHVYNYLKENDRSSLKVKDIEEIPEHEVKEGVIEFALQKERNNSLAENSKK